MSCWNESWDNCKRWQKITPVETDDEKPTAFKWVLADNLLRACMARFNRLDDEMRATDGESAGESIFWKFNRLSKAAFPSNDPAENGRLPRLEIAVPFLLNADWNADFEDGKQDGDHPLKMNLFLDDEFQHRGYVTVLNALRDAYRHVCFLGQFSQEEKRSWLEEWMHKGERPVGQGRLFKHIYDEGYGAVLLVDWEATDTYVSAIPKKLALRWVLVVPLLYFGECVGILTIDFSPQEVFNGDPTNSSKPGMKFSKRVAYVYIISQMIVAPLLALEATRADDGIMDAVANGLEAPQRMTYMELVHASETLRSLADNLSTGSGKRILIDLTHRLEIEARRGLGHVLALQPRMPPFRQEPTCLKELGDLVEECWRRVVEMEANPGFGWHAAEAWLGPTQVEEACPCKTVPLPRPIVAELLRELLSNAYHSVCKKKSNPNSSIQTARRSNSFVQVSAKCHTDGDKRRLCVEVKDHGAGVSPHARTRSRRFGFTGREGGSGWGLAIVERQVKAVDGELEVRPLQRDEEEGEAGGCIVTMRFKY